jgi:hypothetical protein
MENIQEKRQEIRRFLESLDMYEDTDTKSHLTESSGKDESGESLESKQKKKERIRRLIEKLILDDGDSESRLRGSDGDEELKKPLKRIKAFREHKNREEDA